MGIDRGLPEGVLLGAGERWGGAAAAVQPHPIRRAREALRPMPLRQPLVTTDLFRTMERGGAFRRWRENPIKVCDRGTKGRRKEKGSWKRKLGAILTTKRLN